MTAFTPLRPLAVALGAALLLSSPARAQDTSLATTPSASSSTVADTASAPAGPILSEASIAVRRAPVTAAAPAAAAAAGRSRDSGTALMIVGGAAVLTGIVIGNGAGYAISVVGAVIGLYGLYQYLQ